MNWLVVFALLLAGMAAIAASMSRHSLQMLGRGLSSRARGNAKLCGFALIATSFASAIAAFGLSYGLVVFVAAATPAALTMPMLLTYRPRSGVPLIATLVVLSLALQLLRVA